MPPLSNPPVGRRERNKQQKLDRITAAASVLFAERGIDEVTTQEIADAADVATGTLFLYARTKGELLLLVQNAHYAEALDRGHTAAPAADNMLDAVMAYVRPIIECNRTHIENGRTYLREMVFGDPAEPYRAAALEIVGRTQESIAAVLVTRGRIETTRASTLARITSSIIFLNLSVSTNSQATVDALTRDIREQIATLLDK